MQMKFGNPLANCLIKNVTEEKKGHRNGEAFNGALFGQYH